jgi:DNA invertase Pin-like site-specific DNA recombinase
MRWGYGRTSTFEQREGLLFQIKQLQAAGCDEVFSEQVSATDIEGRKEWAKLMAKLEPGDEVMVTKIDRCARSIAHMVSIVEAIQAAGASIRVLDMNIDTRTPTGTLILNVLGSVAQFERDMMLERQRVGIEAKKAQDKNLPLEQRTYRGRAPTARKKADSVFALLALKKSKQQVAEELGIGVASVYRIIADARKNTAQ